jgi:hypothetical protein
LAQKRARDHAAHFMFAAQHVAGDLADFVESIEMNDFFVRRNLED